MTNWNRVGLAMVVGIVVGVATALIGNMFDINGALTGGVAGAITAGLIATTMRSEK